MIILLTLLITMFSHSQETVLFEIHKVKPGNTESFILKSSGNQELFFMSSNRFIPRHEFGWYSRPLSRIRSQLESVVLSQERSVAVASTHEWEVTVLGKKITPNNGRYKDIMNLISYIAQSPQLKKLNVTEIIMGQELKIKKAKDGIVTERKEPFFSVCTREYEEKPTCEIDNGFIFIK